MLCQKLKKEMGEIGLSVNDKGMRYFRLRNARFKNQLGNLLIKAIT